MVVVLLADGFEEIEALCPVDVLRRAGCEVQTAAVGEDRVVCGSHAIPVTADTLTAHIDPELPEAIVLPGGMPGTKNLEASADVQRLIDAAVSRGAVIGAICAAPSILGRKGLLKGKSATCYPGFEGALQGARVTGKAVVRDGNIITARGAGVAVEFALELAGALRSPAVAKTVRESIQCR